MVSFLHQSAPPPPLSGIYSPVGGAPVIREGGEASGLLTAVTWHQLASSEDRFPQKPVLEGSYPCPQTRSIVSLGAERLVFVVIRVSAGSPPHPGTGRAY